MVLPINRGIYDPMSRVYSRHFTDLARTNPEILRVHKHDFWRLFSVTWAEVMTEANITSAFEETGLYPLDASKAIERTQPIHMENRR